jgi:hypothetical protein
MGRIGLRGRAAGPQQRSVVLIASALAGCLLLPWIHDLGVDPRSGLDLVTENPSTFGCGLLVIVSAVAAAATGSVRSLTWCVTATLTGGVALGALARANGEQTVRYWGMTTGPNGQQRFVEWERHHRPGVGFYVAVAIVLAPAAVLLLRSTAHRPDVPVESLDRRGDLDPPATWVQLP